MCQLSALLFFEVRNNSLTGSIPENIGNCTSFLVLDLSYNQLTGEIPFNIGFLQVNALFLNNNQLGGKIPSTIGTMRALTGLDLSCNLLSGPVPPVLGNLTYTHKLYLHHNKLTGSIPPELGNMTRLYYLELNDNQLTGRIPAELGKLTDLFRLKIANNNLEGPIPDSLSSCTNLINLNVHGNKLNGTIPRAFQRLESLTNLNLSSNNIRGPIPVEMSQITNLDTVDISNNIISGSIPSSLGDLEHLLKLNLSRNQLSGVIPAGFGNFRSVVDIDLSNNHLSGVIPQELSKLENMFSLRLENNNLSGDVISLINCPSLAVLNVSYNNLAGVIPTSTNFSRFSPNSFIGNPGLCGYWLNSPCNEAHPTERVTISKVAILDIALGALVLLIILVAACRLHNPTLFYFGSLDKSVTYSIPKLVILHKNMKSHEYEDIKRMTDNLSERYIIGSGASGTVYKCALENSKPVAIKRLNSHHPRCLMEFETELKTIGSIKHRNLVSLQGYYLSPLEKLLCFDYMENGSLWDVLHGPMRRRLNWETRLQIALGAAKGLAYLHHGCSPHIIHRDVKSSNILLDGDFEAHITDFGIAKSLCVSESHTSTYTMGTIGYIDPHYARSSRLTEKSDVYSFGIVLLELLTRRKAVDDGCNLHDLVLSKTIMETVDPDIFISETEKLVEKGFHLALLCTQSQPADRPTMDEVAGILGRLVVEATTIPLPTESPPAPASPARQSAVVSRCMEIEPAGG